MLINNTSLYMYNKTVQTDFTETNGLPKDDYQCTCCIT